MLSLEECAPKRPPRWQKLPLASGTVQFDTIIGRFSIEMSANHTICRASWHSFRIDSSTIMTMSRLPPSLSLANSAIGICCMGKVVCAPFQRRHHEPRDLRRAQIVRRRLLRSFQQFLAVDDLQDAALVGAVAEIDAVALRPGRDRPVQLGRHRAGRARLLAGQAEVADLHRMGGIAEIVDLGHAPGAPVGRAGDEVGDAGVALPPVLVGVLQPVQPGDQDRVGRIGDVPDLMRLAAEGAQHVDGGAIGAGQGAAVAHPHHLRAACLVGARGARQMAQILRIGGIGDVDDRRAVGLGLSGHRIDRCRNVVGAAVMADIGDPAVALAVDRRLIGAARLQVAPAGQPHVRGFRRRADLLLLGVCRARQDQKTDDKQSLSRHGVPSGFASIIQHRRPAAAATRASDSHGCLIRWLLAD